ncbi:MAG TPA: AAA family ATPase [Phycisphaerales bacterium]|nr:hypothetical protein BMS3Abin11_00168 [bacterium BMS3Abin11]HDZ68849.1 AAA family ATPase [Phycisphaerales bacterium]
MHSLEKPPEELSTGDVIVEMPARNITRLTSTSYADIQPQEIDWLWPGRIAIGKLTLIAGDPGLGKSMVSIALASHVSTGSPWPVDRSICPVGNVLMLSAEDDPGDTIRPRLDAAGADVNRVTNIGLVDAHDKEGMPIKRGFDMSCDIPLLDDLLMKIPDCRLVVIDPVSAYLGSTDSHNNANVRGLLAPIGELATRHNVAIVAVTHLNKGNGGNAMYRATGSLAFVAAARASFLVTKDKDEPSRRLFIPMKNNLGEDQTGFAYHIDCADNGAPFIAWEPDAVDVSADEALSINDEYRTERDEAKDWLLEELGQGNTLVAELQKQAKLAGHSWRTVQRAKADLKVTAKRKGFGSEGLWHWSLPDGTFSNN